MYGADTDLAYNPRLLELIESLTDFFALLDSDWRVVRLDARSTQKLGEARRPPLEPVFWKLFPECRSTEVETRFHQAVLQQEPQSFRARGPVSGELQDLYLLPLPGGLMVAGKDVVDLGDMELRLKEASARLAAKLEGMRRLHDIGTQLMRETDLSSLAWKTAESALEITRSDIAILQMVEPQTGKLFVAAHCGLAASLVTFLASEEGREPMVPVLKDQPAIIEDVEKSSVLAGTRALHELREAGIRALLSVPLLNRRGRLLGLLSTCYKDRHRYREREVLFLDLFALQAAELIERARSQAALKESEARLREREDQLSLITNAAPALISYIDVGFRYRLVNATYERWFGQSADEIRGKHVREVLGDAAWERVRPRMEQALAGEQVAWEEELPYRSAGPRWVHMTYTPDRDESGQVRGFVVLVHDIGAAKRAEQALRESEELLRALNRDLERRVLERTAEVTERAVQLQALAAELTTAEDRERRRLAQILHDHLQQLLVGAKIRAAVIGRNLQDKRAQEEMERLNELLHQAIQESRSLTAQLSPPILYDAGLGAALLWLGRWIEENHRLSVRVNLDPQAEPTSMEVRAFLYQACRELLLNVVKHAQVDSAQISLRLAEPEVLELTVEDKGKGFEIHVIANGPQGGGFGLFSIRQRLEHLGGSFEVSSQPDEGTRVRLRLRTSLSIERTSGKMAPASPNVSEESVASASPIRVLLADDQKILREGLSALLRDHPDLEIVGEAADGAEAVALAHSVSPHVVVMDASMPRLNGVEATRRLRAELPQIQVIGLSMYSEHDMAAAMRHAGAASYLTKDGPVELLAAEIRRVAAAVTH
jgi:PAS domain S-box-containing protein